MGAGLAFLLATRLEDKRPLLATSIQWVVTLLLLGKFLGDWTAKGQFMPAGLMALLALGGLAVLAMRLFRRPVGEKP